MADRTTKASAQLAELEALTEALGVKLSYEPMTGIVSGRGGLCRVNGSYRIIIDRRHKPAERIQLLADALSRFDIGGREVSAGVLALLRGAVGERKTA